MTRHIRTNVNNYDTTNHEVQNIADAAVIDERITDVQPNRGHCESYMITKTMTRKLSRSPRFTVGALGAYEVAVCLRQYADAARPCLRRDMHRSTLVDSIPVRIKSRHETDEYCLLRGLH